MFMRRGLERQAPAGRCQETPLAITSATTGSPEMLGIDEGVYEGT
jgi:hypothetical protein